MTPYVTTENLSSKCKQWITKISPFNAHHMDLCVEKSALLVIDMQTFFLDPQSPSFTEGGLAIIPTIKELIAAFRKKNRPVIYTKHVHHPKLYDAGIMEWWWKGMCKEGTPESEVVPQLQPMPDDKVVVKHRYSAFYNTDLETILRCLKIEDIVFTGIMTNMCCESTARDAYFRDYRVFFTADGNGSITEEMHVASLLNLAFGFAYVLSANDILATLK